MLSSYSRKTASLFLASKVVASSRLFPLFEQDTALSSPFTLSDAPTSCTTSINRRYSTSKNLSTSSNNDNNTLVDIPKLLIANRGEIACRVITTAKRLNIPTVAVFSEADRGAKHVAMADEAYCIGPAPARESYLRGDRIIEVALSTGARAVHPGYGFLSENSGFAATCEDNGIAFVGPPATAIEAMGDKSQAKALMSSANVPVVPGYHGEDQSEKLLKQKASEIGFPLLVKAVMGGGGKGMKLALTTKDFEDALHSAKREALASFGDDRVLLERYITSPRHIEVQVIADGFGNALFLFERDCSVQRRHQKVIEEAPAPGVDAGFRKSIGDSAVAAAKAVGYKSAGTVEFIVDSTTGEYFFMEMNTRLQVEHPVTESITGVDLVELQLRVAAGQKLPLTQEDLSIHGHAFEARLYAEDPANGFLPAGGKVLRWVLPSNCTEFAPGDVRIDSGVRQGDSVGVNYDPMIAKVITWGQNRTEALSRLRSTLSSFQVAGLPTNVDFVQRITLNSEFLQGGIDTSFIQRHEETLLAPTPATPDILALGAALYVKLDRKMVRDSWKKAKAAPPAPWSIQDGFRVNHLLTTRVQFEHCGSGTNVELDVVGRTGFTTSSMRVESVGKEHPLGSTSSSKARQGHHEAATRGEEKVVVNVSTEVPRFDVTDSGFEGEIGGRKFTGAWCIHTVGDAQVLDVWLDGHQHQFRRPIIRRWERSGTAGLKGGTVITPMPGKVVKVFVRQGQQVTEGDPLCAIEAMKMEHSVKAPCSGVVAELHAFEGAQVEDGKVLVVVAPLAASTSSAENVNDGGATISAKTG